MQFKAALVPEKGAVEYHTGTIHEIGMWIDSKFSENAVMFRTPFESIDLYDKGELVGTGYKCTDMFATTQFECIAIPLEIFNTHLKGTVQ